MVRLDVPAGWTVEPAQARVALRFEGDEVTSRFFVTAPAGLAPGEHSVRAVAAQGGREFREGFQVIAYDHIQERHLFHPAASRVQAIDVKIAPGVSIGYVLGAGDEVPPAIEQLGLEPTLLSPDDLAYGDLSRFSTIVTGIRAYQTRPDLRANNQRLLDYARAGGHVVVQYNKFEFNRLSEAEVFSSTAAAAAALSPFAPYPASVTYERVTLEEAPMNVLVADHPFFNAPEPDRAPPTSRAGCRSAASTSWARRTRTTSSCSRPPIPSRRTRARRRASSSTPRWARGRGPTSASASGGSCPRARRAPIASWPTS